jgi:hypothetical protein
MDSCLPLSNGDASLESNDFDKKSTDRCTEEAKLFTELTPPISMKELLLVWCEFDNRESLFPCVSGLYGCTSCGEPLSIVVAVVAVVAGALVGCSKEPESKKQETTGSHRL